MSGCPQCGNGGPATVRIDTAQHPMRMGLECAACGAFIAVLADGFFTTPELERPPVPSVCANCMQPDCVDGRTCEHPELARMRANLAVLRAKTARARRNFWIAWCVSLTGVCVSVGAMFAAGPFWRAFWVALDVGAAFALGYQLRAARTLDALERDEPGA